MGVWGKPRFPPPIKLKILFQGVSSMLSIVVDERERGLWEALLPFESALGSFVLSKQVLPLGDVVIKRQEENLILLERKSISDLLASIQDGRYKEQSQRLTHASGMDLHNIVYLIEGPIGALPPSQKQKVYSSMTSILYFKRFSVMRTFSVQESAEWIARMTDKIFREANKSPSQCQVQSMPTTMTAIRKNNITKDNIGEILLVQIPGISKVTAKALLDNFQGSFMKLLKAVENKDPILETIQYPTGDGKTRRISKGIVSKLQELLCTEKT